jgi:hypothetical protein
VQDGFSSSSTFFLRLLLGNNLSNQSSHHYILIPHQKDKLLPVSYNIAPPPTAVHSITQLSSKEIVFVMIVERNQI